MKKLKEISFKKILKIIVRLISVIILITLSVYAIFEIRENNLKKGISIQVKYDAEYCELNLPKNNIKIEKSKMADILDKAPIDVDKTILMKKFVLEGYEIEGINPTFVTDTFKEERAILVNIKNNTNKTLKKVDYSIGINRIGYSTDISSYDLHYLKSDKILKPSEETNFCITKTLKNIDKDFIQSPEKFEFFSKDINPEFF